MIIIIVWLKISFNLPLIFYMHDDLVKELIDGNIPSSIEKKIFVEVFMKLLNVVYEEDFSDVDILSVPEYIYENIESEVQLFVDWLFDKSSRHNYWKMNEKGDEYIDVGTDGFVSWLNEYRLNENSENVTILKSHTKFHPEYKSAEF